MHPIFQLANVNKHATNFQIPQTNTNTNKPKNVLKQNNPVANLVSALLSALKLEAAVDRANQIASLVVSLAPPDDAAYVLSYIAIKFFEAAIEHFRDPANSERMMKELSFAAGPFKPLLLCRPAPLLCAPASLIQPFSTTDDEPTVQYTVYSIQYTVQTSREDCCVFWGVGL